MGFLLSGCFFLFFFTSLFASEGLKIEFLNEQIIKEGQGFEGLAVGGISGASFDNLKGHFLFLSDDKKNHRFYRLQIKSKNPYRLKIIEQVFLREKDSLRLKRNMDPEAIFLHSKANQIFITSEGQQIFSVFDPPGILQFSVSGILERVWPLPPIFWTTKESFDGKKEMPSDKGLHFSSLPYNQILFGPNANKGFESLALDIKNQILYTATEAPLRQDQKSSSGHWIRLSGFSMKGQTLVAQYGYKIKNADKGLVEMLLLKPFVFLTLEREYVEPFYTVRLFVTNCSKSSNFYKKVKLPKHFKPCKKSLLFDFARLSIPLDNLEAMTLGPWISSKERLLVIASDNNFNPAKQMNQILFFKFSEK